MPAGRNGRGREGESSKRGERAELGSLFSVISSSYHLVTFQSVLFHTSIIFTVQVQSV